MYLIILEVKLQAKSGCFVYKAQVVYLFTNNVKKETTISFTKYLMANKINGFNVFKNNYINNKINIRSHTKTKHTVCKHLQNSSFVYITKNSNLCNVLACNSILDFQMTKHLKMIIGMLALITNNLMNIRIFAFVV